MGSDHEVLAVVQLDRVEKTHHCLVHRGRTAHPNLRKGVPDLVLGQDVESLIGQNDLGVLQDVSACLVLHPQGNADLPLLLGKFDQLGQGDGVDVFDVVDRDEELEAPLIEGTLVQDGIQSRSLGLQQRVGLDEA